MKKIIFVLSIFLLSCGIHAQTVTQRLLWDQQSTGDIAVVNAYTYKLYIDGSATPVTLTGVTCAAGTTMPACQATLPALAIGSHTFQLTASNTAGESAKSPLITVLIVAVPIAPANLRIG